MFEFLRVTSDLREMGAGLETMTELFSSMQYSFSNPIFRMPLSIFLRVLMLITLQNMIHIPNVIR